MTVHPTIQTRESSPWYRLICDAPLIETISPRVPATKIWPEGRKIDENENGTMTPWHTVERSYSGHLADCIHTVWPTIIS